jgi:hypothetical protein
VKTRKIVDFEKLGFETMLKCEDIEIAKPICALELQAYAGGLQPELERLESETQLNKQKSAALLEDLYGRPIPVDDAEMLTHGKKARILLALVASAALACLVGQTATLSLLGVGFPLALVGAVGITALPLVVGHFAFEQIVAKFKALQIALAILGVGLCFGGLLRFAEARQMMLEKATETPVTNSYVDGTDADSLAAGSHTEPEPKPNDYSESRIHEEFGNALLLFMIAADLMLGYLVGQLSRMHTDKDYAAWRELQKIAEIAIQLKERISEIGSSIEIAQKRCMAGILRAQNVRRKRNIAYHRALGVVAFSLVALASARDAHAQTIERYEGILIDTSGSIAKGKANNGLFHEYLSSTQQLLLTEPANSRVWVSKIASDSFGGVVEVVSGWTPYARGVFIDDLTRARRQLAARFEDKSGGIVPVSAGTDIFGGLWHNKALFDSAPKSDSNSTVLMSIWIFSDMMNETREFSMPELVDTTPEQMLERAKANRLIVPLRGYKIHVFGASMRNLTPKQWETVRAFWVRYFSAAGAEVVSYSAECDLRR